MMLQRALRQLQQIGRDHTRGARELVLDAATAVHDGVRDAPATAAVTEVADELARAVVGAQPEMAPFYHLSGLLLEHRADRSALLQALGGFVETLRDPALADRAAASIEDGSLVATYSRSGSVMAALLEARREGVDFSVLVGEGRPGGEGRGLAETLAEADITVEFFTDAGLLAELDRADQALLGADAVGARSFRNKVGTRAFCRTARAAGCPVLLVTDATKFLPEELWPPIRPRDPAEVWPAPPSRVRVRNPYFETIPLADLESIITGQGALDAREILASVKGVADRLRPVRALLSDLGDG